MGCQLHAMTHSSTRRTHVSYVAVCRSLSLSLLLTFSDDEIVVKNDHIQAMGGLDQVDLAWQDIKMTLQTGKKNKNTNNNGEKLLLDGSLRGRARPGRMLAIMGPRYVTIVSILYY